MSSTKQLIAALPYFANSAELFSSIADQPWAVFLDSGYPHSKQGRYDIIAADPVCTLTTYGNLTEIIKNGASTYSDVDPFALVKQHLLSDVEDVSDLPFNGGAIGYFSYDLARRLERLPQLAEDAEHIAEMAIGIY
ncbi:MAG: aminodeoxychorismate synthase component I, partial [Methylococcales bacterium]